MNAQGSFELPGGSDAGAWRALTLSQPFASLVAGGEKRIETRSWYTSYRGPLAIHAGAGIPPEYRELPGREPFRSALDRCRRRGHFTTSLPRGVMVATCELVGCQYIDAAGKEFDPAKLSDLERAFGNYTPGRYAWILIDVQPLAAPVPAKGALGLWTWQRQN